MYTCLQELGIISPSFPLPYALNDKVQVVDVGNPVDLPPCGCPKRTEVPDPPIMPYEPREENVPKLKEFIMNYYASSTMNLCSHKTLPEVTGPPLNILVNPDAVPVAVHTTAKVPTHWMREVKEQLDRDVKMGILLQK